MTFKRKTEPGPPVVAGPMGITRGEPLSCVACGYGMSNGVLIGAQVVEGEQMLLCLDASACSVRVRRGTSPESYAACLRGEILGVIS